MIQNSNITVIVPLHKCEEGDKELFIKAIASVPEDVKIFVATTKSVKAVLEDVERPLLFGEQEPTDTSFSALVNYGVACADTEWVSILEFDDVYTPNAFKNFALYQEYNQEHNLFLPLNDLFNAEDNKFCGNGNEVAWAKSFSDKLGVLDSKAVETYGDFYLNGGFFRKSTWEELGGLKVSMKLTFWYELMLRWANKGETFYVIPKVGYVHYLMREGSLMAEYKDQITPEENEFWVKTALSERYFKEDRGRVYEPSQPAEEKPAEEKPQKYEPMH